MTSAFWNSLRLAYPVVAIEVRSAPNRFIVPSLRGAGPFTISLSVPSVVVRTLVPRGSSGWKVAIPQWCPRPGASRARASGEPSMTASAPQAIALAMSPPVRIPPSAMMCT